jgi:hypothetical protein
MLSFIGLGKICLGWEKWECCFQESCLMIGVLNLHLIGKIWDGVSKDFV